MWSLAPKKPDSSTLVSTTARRSPGLGTKGFHLAIDFFHRHRLDPGVGHAVDDRQKCVGSLPAPDRSFEQPFEAWDVESPASRAARAVASDRSF
jgi:hypothetical protein